jgi:hypothetical protein
MRVRFERRPSVCEQNPSPDSEAEDQREKIRRFMDPFQSLLTFQKEISSIKKLCVSRRRDSNIVSLSVSLGYISWSSYSRVDGEFISHLKLDRLDCCCSYSSPHPLFPDVLTLL